MKRIICIVLVLLCLAGCTSVPNTGETSGNAAATTQTAEQPIQNTSDENLNVHFIDVGQADAAFIKCGGACMLIDGGNADDSNRIVAFLKKQNIGKIDIVVCTHAHEDHVGGLSGALEVYKADKVLAPETLSDSKAYTNFIKKAKEQGVEVTNAKAGDEYSLGDAKIKILAPVNESGKSVNNTSIVLKLTYGETSFLFMGDAEREEEQDILSMGYDLSADVLKVGHHGSDSSTSYPFLREVIPSYAVISVGKGNSYGHPSDNTISKLKDAGVMIWRTDICGDILAISNGKTVTMSGTKKAAETKPESKTEGTVIGNRKSKIYHTDKCKSLPSEKNRIYFKNKSKAEQAGYKACQSCN